MVAPGAGNSKTSLASCSGEDFPAESADTRGPGTRDHRQTPQRRPLGILWFFF